MGEAASRVHATADEEASPVHVSAEVAAFLGLATAVAGIEDGRSDKTPVSSCRPLSSLSGVMPSNSINIMNIRLSILFSLLLSSIASAGTVSLQIKANSENKTADKKKAEVTRATWLNVRITNPSSTKLEGITLKWTLYADNLRRGSDSIVVEKSGEMKISVDASGRYVDVATPKVAFVYTPMHTESTGSGRRMRSKTVEESGHRYHGYHVQVVSGDTVLGDAVSNEALRKQFK